MANLAEAVDATETDWIISADLDDDIDFLTVEDEIVHVTANFPAQYQAATGTTSVPRIRVERGAGGTTAASHADTTALTPLIPPSSSAGGGSAAVLTGTETTQRTIYVGDEDPAVEHAADLISGDIWRDTSAGLPYGEYERNDANDGWAPVVAVEWASGVAIRLIGIEGVTIRSVVNAGQPDVVVWTQSPDGGWQLSVSDPAVAVLGVNYNGVSAYCGPNGFDLLPAVDGGFQITGPTFLNLPTVDPAEAGQLWNDAGVVKVSAG